MRIIRRRRTVHRVDIVVGTENCTTEDGVLHEKIGSIYNAARHLISQGVDPNDHMEVWRGETLSLRGKVDAFAVRAWGGSARDPYESKWAPSPWTKMNPVLSKWWDKKSK